jgi:hypothetical protein
MSALSIVDLSSGNIDLTRRQESAIVTDMDTPTHTDRPFGIATYEVLVGNLEGAIAFNASPQLIAQLVNEIAFRDSLVKTEVAR